MASNRPRLAKKAARKSYVSTDGPADTGAHSISTAGPSAGEDSSGAPSTRGPGSSTGISTGSTVRPRNLASKSARKAAVDLPPTASRYSTGDDDSDPPPTRSLKTSTGVGSGTRPLSTAVKASRKVAFRDLPPPSSRHSAVEPDAAAPSGHHGRILRQMN
ncbi:hypothetical protein EDD16DRAFT_505040 [Pisolithus croceorrhizus]|nr:hypothetical protein EDD16DRAFT_505040 [Pisolithus croceorrhizus]